MKLSSFVVSVLLWSATTVWMPAQEPDGPRKIELSAAVYYTEQFEESVRTARGKPFAPGHFGSEAMKRVAALARAHPDDPKCQELRERVARCVRLSRGAVFELTDAMVAYRKSEETVTTAIATRTEAAWNELSATWKASPRFLESAFPAPETGRGRRDTDQFERRVVLEDFRYPENEFSNSGRQYVFVGDRARGMYFVDLSERDWIRCYEAVRRYRRLVNADLPKRWTLVGTIADVEMLVPRTGQPQPSDVAVMGWIVRPEAIFIEGKLLALAVGSEGQFVGEDVLPELNRTRWTVKDVPQTEDAEVFVSAFITAVKEKNFDLTLQFLDPTWSTTPRAKELVRHRWRIAQERFRDSFVHAHPVEVATPRVLQGEKFGGEEDLESFFLTEDDKQDIESRADALIEELTVRCARFDAKGKQVGAPVPVVLRRYRGGRWFIYEGLPL